MALPCLISEGISQGAAPSEIDPAVPVLIGRGLAVLFKIAESKKLTSRMVENTVHHNADAVFVALLHEFLKIIVCAQTSVYEPEIPCVVSMP